MRLPGLKQVFIASNVTLQELARLLLQFVENVRQSLELLLSNPRAKSTVQSVDLTAATAEVINHGLEISEDKTPNGWAISDIDAAATVYRSAWDNRTITLVASATCTVQLEVW